MKRLAVAVLLALAAGGAAGAAAAAQPHARAAAATPPCIPKISHSGGHVSVDYCGPATATMTVGGKTYSFKNGYCSKNTKDKIQLELTLGVIDEVKSSTNGGEPLFELNDLDTSTVTIATVNADYGGKVLDTIGTVSLKGSIPGSGSFTSKGFSTKFSGSWNCHGVVYDQP